MICRYCGADESEGRIILRLTGERVHLIDEQFHFVGEEVSEYIEEDTSTDYVYWCTACNKKETEFEDLYIDIEDETSEKYEY